MLAFYLSLIESEEEKCRFEEVYNTYKKQMAHLANSLLKNQYDAEDVVHDIFCSIASSHMDVITKATSEEDIRIYLLRSVKNASVSVIRKKKVRTDYEKTKLREKCELSDNAFVDKVCNKIEFERFLKILETLDQKYREVLYYHLVLDLSVNETAGILGKPPNTVRQQIARGKNIVAKLLEEK